jgi:hypothetical protein
MDVLFPGVFVRTYSRTTAEAKNKIFEQEILCRNGNKIFEQEISLHHHFPVLLTQKLQNAHSFVKDE